MAFKLQVLVTDSLFSTRPFTRFTYDFHFLLGLRHWLPKASSWWPRSGSCWWAQARDSSSARQQQWLSSLLLCRLGPGFRPRGEVGSRRIWLSGENLLFLMNSLFFLVPSLKIFYSFFLFSLYILLFISSCFLCCVFSRLRTRLLASSSPADFVRLSSFWAMTSLAKVCSLRHVASASPIVSKILVVVSPAKSIVVIRILCRLSPPVRRSKTRPVQSRKGNSQLTLGILLVPNLFMQLFLVGFSV